MIYILDKEEDIVGVLSNESPNACPYFDDLLKESLEDFRLTYEFKVPSNHDTAELIEEGGYFIRKGLDGELLMFRIKIAEEDHFDTNYKYVYGESAGLELLYTTVRPTNQTALSAERAMSYVLAESRWTVGTVEVPGTTNLQYDDYATALQRLLDLATTFSGELRFRVEIDGGKVFGRYVDLLERRGSDTGKQFTYTKDIKSIKRTVDTTNIVTALIGVGKGDDNGNYVTFTDVSWSKDKGDPADKPPGQDWIGDDDAAAQWGVGGRHLFGVYQCDSENAIDLINKTWEQLKTQSQPNITYELDVALLEFLAGYEFERVRLGDTVVVYDKTFSPVILVNARVQSLEISFTNPENNKATLSNFTPAKTNITSQLLALQSKLNKKEAAWDSAKTIANSAQQIAQQAQETANNANQVASTAQETASNAQTTANNAQQSADAAQQTAENAQETAENAENMANNALETANTALTSANGKNTNYYGPDQPENPVSGDLWFKDNDDGTITIYQYDGTQWVQFIDHDTSQSLNELRQSADNAVSTANAANSAAQDALNQAQSAFNTAQDASTKADDATNQISTITQTIEGLQSTVANKADQSTVTQLANVVDTKISQADADARYATQSQLTQTANSLTSTITSIQQDLDSYQSQITQLSNDINLRVQKNDVINQINLSTEGILIDGKKVHITGQTTIDNAVIKDAMIQSVSADKLTAGTIDAGVITVKNLTASSIKSLNGLNINNQFIVDSNGNVTFKGNLDGATGTFSGNISTSADAKVGNNINLGNVTDHSQKEITFNDRASISSNGSLLRVNGPGIVTITNNSGAYVEMDGNTVSIGGILSVDEYLYVDPNNLRTSMTETSNCGVAGWNPGTSGVFAGTWQPFKVTKTYTPTTVNLTTGDHNLTSLAGVKATAATINGFWLYLTGQQATPAYKYWRGTYSA